MTLQKLQFTNHSKSPAMISPIFAAGGRFDGLIGMRELRREKCYRLPARKIEIHRGPGVWPEQGCTKRRCARSKDPGVDPRNRRSHPFLPDRFRHNVALTCKTSFFDSLVTEGVQIADSGASPNQL